MPPLDEARGPCADAPSGGSAHPVSARSVLRERQREGKFCARATLAGDGDPSAVRIDDAFCDRQPEPRAPGLLPTVPVAIENMRQLGIGDSRALVAHREDGVLAIALERDLDRRALGVLERIADQIT